jgi:phospholipid N-methyltransferase
MLETMRFLKQTACRFRQTGALLPSSALLARAMVAEVPALRPGEVIVELGPGTGAFTRELGRRFPFNPIIAVESNHSFAERLREDMPQVEVVESCASLLPSILDELGIPADRVGTAVSGLPLLSLPRELSACIFAVLAEVLRPGARFVQFTYSKRAWRRVVPPGFRLDKTRKVWLNVPPAEVLPFTRIAA